MRAVILFAILLMPFVAFSQEFQSALLSAHAKMLPKIMLLDQNYRAHLVDDKIVIAVVYQEGYLHAAQTFAELVERHYGGNMAGHPIETLPVPIETFDPGLRASALYLLPLSGEKSSLMADFSREHSIISFSYDVADLKRGVLLSLQIESRTVIYFNRSAWPSESIKLHPNFFKVVRSYE